VITSFIIIAVYGALLGLLIFRYEKPTRDRKKLTGRGGDFAE
jgi:hypothetical protein